MRRSRALALLLAPFAVAGRVAAQELFPLRAVTSPQDVATPALYAIKAGLFRRAGLTVDLQPVQSGSAAAVAVAGGAVEVGLGSIPNLLSAHVRGVPFTLIAPGGLYVSEKPMTLLLTRKGATFQDGRDLAGKTVGVLALADLFSLSNKAWIDATGGDYRTVKFIEMPTSALLPALEDGRIDAASLSLPALSEALDSGKVRILAKTFDTMAKRLDTSAWFATEDYVAKHGDVLTRFIRVIREANIYTNAHPAETVDVLAAFSGIDAKLIARTPRAINAEYLDPRAIQPLIDTAAKYKLIERPFNAQDFISPIALVMPSEAKRSRDST